VTTIVDSTDRVPDHCCWKFWQTALADYFNLLLNFHLPPYGPLFPLSCYHFCFILLWHRLTVSSDWPQVLGLQACTTAPGSAPPAAPLCCSVPGMFYFFFICLLYCLSCQTISFMRAGLCRIHHGQLLYLCCALWQPLFIASPVPSSVPSTQSVPNTHQSTLLCTQFGFNSDCVGETDSKSM
jgi:hypothetical protein